MHHLLVRQKLKACIREFFESRGYLEVDTPLLVSQPGTEVHIDYFSSSYIGFRGEQESFSLRSSPELHMKQLLAEGLQKIFQLGPSFRNGGEYTKWHHPEFYLLEWYHLGSDLDGMIFETDQLIRFCLQRFNDFSYLGFDRLPDLHQIGVFDAFEKYANITLVDEDPHLGKKAASAGCVSVNTDDDFETAFFKILMEKVEPRFKDLDYVCLRDFPPSQAILSKVSNQVAHRFEFYLKGIEISNAFFECQDVRENETRIREVNEKRKQLGKDPLRLDEHFFQSLRKGLPECCGNALGFDRLLALLVGEGDIDSVVPFRRQFLDRHP